MSSLQHLRFLRKLGPLDSIGCSMRIMNCNKFLSWNLGMVHLSNSVLLLAVIAFSIFGKLFGSSGIKGRK